MTFSFLNSVCKTILMCDTNGKIQFKEFSLGKFYVFILNFTVFHRIFFLKKAVTKYFLPLTLLTLTAKQKQSNTLHSKFNLTPVKYDDISLIESLKEEKNFFKRFLSSFCQKNFILLLQLLK